MGAGCTGCWLEAQHPLFMTPGRVTSVGSVEFPVERRSPSHPQELEEVYEPGQAGGGTRSVLSGPEGPALQGLPVPGLCAAQRKASGSGNPHLRPLPIHGPSSWLPLGLIGPPQLLDCSFVHPGASWSVAASAPGLPLELPGWVL